MTKRDKQIVKAAFAALEQYWKANGYGEGFGEPECDDGCDGCVECDLEKAWGAWGEAADKLRGLTE